MLNLKYDANKTKLAVDTVKTLGVDAIERAKSGHPGMLLDIADTALILYHYFLRFNPDDPAWIGRDNFILSSGHVSMLLYSLLHLYGYDISIDDIKNFRQLNSKTAGHPEYDVNLGIETTTGPLGQGFAMAVGMALARKILVTKYGDAYKNTVYTIMGDGDLMEGISYEAASIAGHLELDNLVAIYDRNAITIDGSIDITFTEDIVKRFEAQNWRVIEVADAQDHSAIIGALNTVTLQKTKQPTLIIVHSVIAIGAGDKEGSNTAHGSPLGKDAVLALKQNLKWGYQEFEVPSTVYDFTREKISLMREEYTNWQNKYAKTLLNPKSKLDTLSKELKILANKLTETKQEYSTRKLSGEYMQLVAKYVDKFVGGSADLAGSNSVLLREYKYINASDFSGRNVHFGIREHAMGAIANGMALSGLTPFVSTFLVFSDYMRQALRLSALMGTKVIYIFTHDSIWVGEDGPTHEPIEHLDSLRLIPNLRVYRPASSYELAQVWSMILKDNGPSVLILTRQNLPLVPVEADISKGAYIVHKEKAELALTILASGSELAYTYSVISDLDEGVKDKIRLVSVPELNLLKSQEKEFIESLIPKDTQVLIVEAGYAGLWAELSDNMDTISIRDFGRSGKGADVASYYGLDKDSIKNKILSYFK